LRQIKPNFPTTAFHIDPDLETELVHANSDRHDVGMQ
jgi:hypothetical protein